MIATENSNVAIKPEAKEIIKNLDAVIFDIDGVLIDVAKSFRATIINTVQFYFSEILKYKGQEILVRVEEIQLFKDAGGFNNDWELTEAIALFYIAKSVKLDSKDLAVLRFQEPYLESFIMPGLKEFKNEALNIVGKKQKVMVNGLWNKVLIRQIFQEMYAGTRCKDFYGFEPAYFKGSGAISKERPLLDTSLINKPVAVITGRAPSETKAAIELTGLTVDEEFIISDDGSSKVKPDPEPLKIISDKMGLKLGIYIGDVQDDYQMVDNFNRSENDRRFLSAMITSSPEKFQAADIIADNVNDVLRIINDKQQMANGE